MGAAPNLAQQQQALPGPPPLAGGALPGGVPGMPQQRPAGLGAPSPAQQQARPGAPGSAPGSANPALAPLAPGWTEHTAPDGRKYYHNKGTGKSAWVRPVAEAAPAPAAAPKPEPVKVRQHTMASPMVELACGLD